MLILFATCLNSSIQLGRHSTNKKKQTGYFDTDHAILIERMKSYSVARQLIN